MKVNEGVIDGDYVHFARIKSSPGDQAPDAAKSIHFDLHPLVSGMMLAQHGSCGYLSNGQEQRAGEYFKISSWAPNQLNQNL